MTDAIVITTTTASEAEAQNIAKKLVAIGSAACVQIDGPIESHYHWDGEIRCDQEWRLSIKTLANRFEAVKTSILRMHSYDQPEIIATPITSGSEGYLQWLRTQVKDSEIAVD